MALAVVGGAALSGFFQQVFVKLDSQEVKNFVRGKKLTDGLLKKLRIELMSVSAVYDDAEQKQLSNPDVKLWLHELKEAVLDAEDLLGEIKTEALRRKIEAEFGSSTSKIIQCPEFVGFPHGGGLQAPNLKTMAIYDCNNFRSLPAEKHASLPSLKSLDISDCPELESFPEGGLPSKLCTLSICSCKKLMANRMRWGLQTLTSLKDLEVGFSKCEEREIGESFPEEGLLPTTLTSLTIFGHPNLKTIDGKALRHLISLETLKIYDCPQLQSLPDEGLPTSLSCLDIWQCDLLTQRCQQDTGEDWAKISHIPNVKIDGI